MLWGNWYVSEGVFDVSLDDDRVSSDFQDEV